MTTATFDHRPLPAPRARVGAMAQVLAWLAAAILLLQLVAATGHHHDAGHPHRHCAGCVLAAQPPAPPADPVLVVLPVRAAVLQHVLRPEASRTAGPGAAVPTPRAQGPPAAAR